MPFLPCDSWVEALPAPRTQHIFVGLFPVSPRRDYLKGFPVYNARSSLLSHVAPRPRPDFGFFEFNPMPSSLARQG